MRWLGPALGPLAVAVLLLGAVLWQVVRNDPSPDDSGPATPPERFTRVDISSLAPDDALPDWKADQGRFRLVDREGRTVLELAAEPMEEGRVVWNRLLPNEGILRARMWGERTRRNAPRFALGLVAGSSFWFRLVPLQQSVELVGNEENVIAAAPWDGPTDQPFWLEFRFRPDPGTPEGGSHLEGRVWFDGEERPESPTVEARVNEKVAFARAVVAGAPYALQPIHFDFLEVEAR